jgi:sugar lactone lactonase YvrE
VRYATAKQTDWVIADLRGPESGVPDGMKVDVAGNVYCGGAGGIYILIAIRLLEQYHSTFPALTEGLPVGGASAG